MSKFFARFEPGYASKRYAYKKTRNPLNFVDKMVSFLEKNQQLKHDGNFQIWYKQRVRKIKQFYRRTEEFEGFMKKHPVPVTF